MLTIDTHCHVSEDWFEPVEVLLFQMERNQVDKAVLLQTWTFDNSYILDCVRQYPGRFVAVGHFDMKQPDASATLERLVEQGLQGIRLTLLDLPDEEPLMVFLRKAEELRLTASCLGMSEQFGSDRFRTILEAVPRLKIMVEHMGYPKHSDLPPYDAYRKILSLAEYPNVYVKVPGFGEFMPRPMPLVHPPFDLSKAPPFIDMAFAAFGADRLTIGTDAPPCAHREGYANVWRYLREYMSQRTTKEREAIFGGTAASLFKFG